MAFVHGLGHFGLLRLDRFGLLADPLLGRRQRLLELLSGALLVPVRADKRLSPIVGIVRAMVVPALEAVFLYHVALPVRLVPFYRRFSRIALRGGPVPTGLARPG